MLPALLGIPSKLATLLTRLSAVRAGYLDNLDGAITDCAQISDGWDAALATSLGALSLTSQSIEYTTESANFTVPAGVTLIYATLVGGGGSGSAGRGSTSIGGGGAGGTIFRFPLKVTAGANVAYSVGAGGAAVAQASSGITSGNDGSDTTFGTLTAVGGNGGVTITGGAAVWSGAEQPVDYCIQGGAGGTGNAAGETVVGMYAGGAPDTSGSTHAGGGGASALGAGGAGGSEAASATAAAGTKGAGGGSATSVTSGTATSGAGGDGYILIEWVG